MSSNRLHAAALALAAILSVFGQSQVRADSLVPVAPVTEARALDFTTERVVVFKDGHGLFVKVASGYADAEGRLYTDDVPGSAVLGTFWATADDDEIVSMKAQWVEQTRCIEKETDCLNNLELLRANQGAVLSLQMVYGESITGTLVDVLEVTGESARLNDGSSTVGGRLAIMQTLLGMKVLPIGSIRTITGEDLVTRMTRRTELTERTKRLWFDLGAAAGGREVTIRLFYFTPGIRWIPTYRLGGELECDGQLALQAEILNEVEDIDSAVFDLVVGVPNFRYKGTISPLSLERVMVNALNQSAPGLMGQQMSNARFAQRSGEWRGDKVQPGPAEGGGVAVLAAQLTATAEQDLFVYSVEELSLARGDRATVALWQSSVPLRHLYTMDVQAGRNWQSSPRPPNKSGSLSPLRLVTNNVWHQLELTNGTEVPWTTGPVMLLRTFLPLGQELLTYTPRGGRMLLPVTVAVDVRGTYAEQEIDREARALYWGNHHWARIHKKGTVTLTNYRDEPIDMLITVSAVGNAQSASDGGTIRIDSARHAAVNHDSEVTWKISLEPGESRTLTYVFSYYVR